MASSRPNSSRMAARTGTRGSMTVTTTEAGPSTPLNVTQGTLRLRAEAEEPSEQRRIQWAEDVIDNEGMGKKSSKVCCIYHKPREAGESSSDESSSSSSDDSDSGPDTSRAQPAIRRRAHHHHRVHGDQAHGPDPNAPPEGNVAKSADKGKGKAPKKTPNAYEKVPSRPK